MTKVEGDFSLVGLTPWSLGEGLHWRLPAGDSCVSRPDQKERRSHGITQRPLAKLRIPWLFLSSGFFLAPPFSVHLPSEGKNLLLPSALFQSLPLSVFEAQMC